MKVDNDVALENRLSRVDALLKVAGAAKYASDQYPAKMIYGKLLRFPYGAGTVKSADADAARAVPGVLEVEIDLAETAKYPGWVIGHIVAENRAAIGDAEEAAALAFDATSAASVADRQYDGAGALDAEAKQRVDDVLGRSAAVVEGTWRTQVQTHSCLETHGTVVDFHGDSADVWGNSQSTFSMLDMAEPLGIDRSAVRVDNEFVGGGFGSKFGIGAEGRLAAQMSKKYKRPCKVMLDRREEHLDAGNRPGSIQYIALGAGEDGRILGGRIDGVSIVGFGRGGGGVTNLGDKRFDNYDLGAYEFTQSEINLNFSKPRAFRAPGWPQAVFALEGAVDELAEKLGIDPVEMRRINYRSARRHKQLGIGAELIGWNRRAPTGSQTGRVRTGFGVAGAMWPVWNTECGAEADIHRTGQVEVRVGVQDIGTGTFTLVTDVAAHELGLDRSLVRGKVGRSSYPQGPGSGGSQVSRAAAPATTHAVRAALADLTKIVAKEWKMKPEDVGYSGGVFTGGAKTLEWRKACALMSGDKITASGRTETGQEGDGTSDCVQFAEVEVDTETGIVRVKRIVAVHAAGVIVNRITIENQICGGVVQGLSYALFENVRLDPNTGAMVNPEFINYKLAGPVDIPEIVPVLDVEEGDTGVRPIGEPATIPTAAAIGNAIANAIGARVRELPMTPERVLAALDTKGAGT